MNSRNIIEDLQQRWATHRGSREATPTPDASNASPEGNNSQSTSPPARPGNILDDIKGLLNEKREKFEEEMSKRKAARSGTSNATNAAPTASSTTAEETGVEEAPAEVLHQTSSSSREAERGTSPVQSSARSVSPVQAPSRCTSPMQAPLRSASPVGPGPASRGHSPSHRSSSTSKDNSPQGTLNFSEMLARVKSRSKSNSKCSREGIAQ